LKYNISAEKLLDDIDKKITEIKKAKEIIERLNGKLYLELSENQNFKIVITIPLKFAITEALMVKIDGDLFAIPLEMVSETKRISESEIKKVKNKDVINYRENTIPLIDSYDFLDFKKQENESSDSEIEVVIVNSGKKSAALRVDELLNQQDIVVKSLGDLLSSTKNIAGATIIGDGEIALIMDVRDIA
jgi:two-component system chemotaxis sensor kinase CheA